MSLLGVYLECDVKLKLNLLVCCIRIVMMFGNFLLSVCFVYVYWLFCSICCMVCLVSGIMLLSSLVCRKFLNDGVVNCGLSFSDM